MVNRGITFIELLIVAAIIGIVALIVLPAFSSIKEKQVLNNGVENVISALNKARGETLSSLDSSSYGVYFSSGEIVIFKGTIYSSADPDNEIISITSPASISNVTLGGQSGGAGEMYFNRLTGSPSKSGTITISSPSYSKIITLSATGAVSKN